MVNKEFSIEFSDTENTRLTIYLDSGVVSGLVSMSIDGFKRNCTKIRECISSDRYIDICFDLDDENGGFVRLPFKHLEENVFHAEPVKKD